jgi:hypothetical protein
LSVNAHDVGQSDLLPIVRNHMMFWRSVPVDAPLFSTSRWPHESIQEFDWGLPGDVGTLEPDMLRVEHFVPQYESYFARKGALDGDLFWSAMPPRAIPWFEAILGCPIEYSLREGAIFSTPVTAKALGAIGRFDEKNAWYQKLLEFIRGIAESAAGRFPVGIPLTRGPWDLACAVRGATNIYLDLYDNPSAVAELADACVCMWVKITEGIARTIPRWHGGYVNLFGLWAPEFCPVPQNDASASVSPEIYRRVMRAADLKMLDSWPYPLFHLHSGGLQVLDAVVEVLRGRAVNFCADPSGPRRDALATKVAAVQSHGIPVHLRLDEWQDVLEFRSRLSPTGLAITYVPQ